jgi:hypothetical protein
MAIASKGKVRYLRDLYRTLRLSKLFITNIAWQQTADCVWGTPVQSREFYEQWTTDNAGHPLVQAAFAKGGIMDGEEWFNQFKALRDAGVPVFKIDSMQEESRPLSKSELADNKAYTGYLDRLGALRWEEAEFRPIQMKRLNEFTKGDIAQLEEATKFVMSVQEQVRCQRNSQKASASI